MSFFRQLNRSSSGSVDPRIHLVELGSNACLIKIELSGKKFSTYNFYFYRAETIQILLIYEE